MKTCQNCGTQLPDDSILCSNCGVAVDQVPVEPGEPIRFDGGDTTNDLSNNKTKAYPDPQPQAVPQGYYPPSPPAYSNPQYQAPPQGFPPPPPPVYPAPQYQTPPQGFPPPQPPVYPSTQYQAPPQGYGMPQTPVYPVAPGQAPNPYYPVVPAPVTGISKTAKVFMILATIISPIYLFTQLADEAELTSNPITNLITVIIFLLISAVTLAWCIPMTVKYCKALKQGRRLGVAFKVCCLIFVSPIAGILMLCDKNH